MESSNESAADEADTQTRKRHGEDMLTQLGVLLRESLLQFRDLALWRDPCRCTAMWQKPHKTRC
jgi:hypothetical protein